MSTEIAKKESNALSTHVDHGHPTILKSDLIVPYLSLGQGLSEAVQEKKVELGDIYRSTSAEKLGDPDHPVEVILLHPPKAEWVYEQKGKSKFEYRRSEQRHPGNETLPWSFWADDDGVEMEPGAKGASEWRRVKRLTVFALLPRDIEAMKAEMAKLETGELPDPNKALLPVALSFRSTSYATGRELINFVSQCASFKTPVWKYSLPLFDVLEKNDEGSFYIWKTDRTKTKAVTKDHMPFVEDWITQLGAGVALKVDEEGESAANASVAQPRDVNSKVAKEVC